MTTSHEEEQDLSRYLWLAMDDENGSVDYGHASRQLVNDHINDCLQQTGCQLRLVRAKVTS
jgi:hypothetical protein